MTNKQHQLQQKLFYCFGDRRDALTIYVGYAGLQRARVFCIVKERDTHFQRMVHSPEDGWFWLDAVKPPSITVLPMGNYLLQIGN